jgi:hypothetical protein
MRDMVNEEKHLEQQYQGDPTNITVAIPLIAAYARHGLMDKMDKVANATIVRPDLSPKDLWQIGQFYMQINRPDRYGQVLSVFIQKYPQSPTAWYELAVVHAVLEDCNKAAMSMKQALTLDTPDRKMFYQLQQDDRFGKCAQSDAAFRSLLTEIQSGAGMLPEPFKVTP